ncbi:MerR family DNA-binding protein [Saccharomonospora saliphila]|uniref:MerR family DNA-binding protein n=1 Tax=Saccharomonospora saliphila TaxID=369829 RepID=UPI0038CD851F
MSSVAFRLLSLTWTTPRRRCILTPSRRRTGKRKSGRFGTDRRRRSLHVSVDATEALRAHKGNPREGLLTDTLLPIDRISRESGIASSALRYYERCGLISEGTKIRGKRHYSRSVLARLSVIKACQAMGFSLNEISEILEANSPSSAMWRQLAQRRKSDIESQIELLRSISGALDSALDCHCPTLIDCPLMSSGGTLAEPARRAPFPRRATSARDTPRLSARTTPTVAFAFGGADAG